MAVMLRVYSAMGAVLGELSDQVGLKRQAEHSGSGSLAFSYPASGRNAHLLALDDVRLTLIEDGVQAPERYLLEDDGDDLADEGGAARMIGVGARGELALLERAIVYPAGHAPGKPVQGLDPHFDFAKASPGAIAATLLARAQARGVLPGVKVDFTAAADSAGRAWPAVYNIRYDAGADLLKVLTSMVEAGWTDVRMRSGTLSLYVPDTVCGVDRPKVIVRLSREVLKGPRQRSRRAVRSHILSIGDAGSLAEASNATTEAKFGRREGYDGRGGIRDQTTLKELARIVLDGVSSAAEGFTLALDGGCEHVPGVDYQVGDYIRYDARRLATGKLEPLRVRTIATEWDEAGNRRYSIELNDVFVEARIKLQRRLDAVLGGSVTGSPVPKPPIEVPRDTSTPKAPAAIVIGSWAYQGEDGQTQATAAVSWPAVTENDDGTVYDDHANYFVSLFLPDTPGPDGRTDWSPEQAVNLTRAVYSGLPPKARVQARVRTVDIHGNSSPHTLSDIAATANDAQPPPRSSTPVIEPLIAGLRVLWDGKGAAGEAMPADFLHTEVHLSTSAGFTPSPTTLVDTLPTAGAAPLAGLDYAETFYVRLVAVDRAGNRAEASVEASGRPVRIGEGDLDDGSIPGIKIKKASIGDAQIGNLSATKIITGILKADVTVAGRLMTSPTGARLQLDATGLHAYDASGQQKVRIGADGDIEIVGTLRTGIAGANRVLVDNNIDANWPGFTFERSGQAPQRKARVFLDGSSVLWLQSAQTSKAPATKESALSLASDGYYLTASYGGYGEILADSRLNLAARQGNLTLSAPADKDASLNAGNLYLRAAKDMAEVSGPWLRLAATKSYLLLSGRLPHNNPYADLGLIPLSYLATGTVGGVVITYGPTLDSAPAGAVVTPYVSSGFVTTAVRALTRTQVSVAWQPAASVNVQVLLWR